MLTRIIKREVKRFSELLTLKRFAILMLGTAILSFGLYNIHRRVA
jgi:hypothetical protein